MQHTQIEQTLDRNNAVPTVDYNFVKVADIQNVNDKDKIDILVLVTKVGTCVTQALRSGRDTKKREVTGNLIFSLEKSQIQILKVLVNP